MEDFNYEIEEMNEVIHIALYGKMDTRIADKMVKEIDLADYKSHMVELDFSKLEYLSSYGLRFILMLLNYVDDFDDGKLIVSGCNDAILQVLKISGFMSFLTIV